MSSQDFIETEECSGDRIRRAANATLDSCDVMFVRITRFKAQLALFMKS